MSAKKFNTPFAILGDKVEVPTTAQVDGSVSFEQGYPFGYELDYTDPNTKDISRSKTNQLLFDITNAIREIQQGGVSEWSEDGKPYKINSLVYAPDGTIKQSLIANNNNATTHSSWSTLVNASTLATLDTQNVKLSGNQTIGGVKTFSSIIAGSINGNSATATKLQTARTINGVSFDGTANITVADSTAVKLTGDQTIAGVKTFSVIPVAPTPTAGDDSRRVATTAFVKAKSEADSIGISQTWQNMTASRSSGVTYTNNTGKPIMVALSLNGGSGVYGYVIVDGLNIFYFGDSLGTVEDNNTGSFIVPAGSTYRVNFGYVSGGSSTWLELR